jgi:hypothetical protein
VAASGRAVEVDALLRAWRTSPDLALPTFLTIWRAGPTDERISWLVEDVASQRLPSSTFRWLTLGGWGARANTGPLRTFARALLGTTEIPAVAAALSMVLAHLDAHPEAGEALSDELTELVMRLASVPDPDTMLSYEWELACKKLRAAGRFQTVIDAAMEALRSTGRVGFADRAWTVLQPIFATHAAEIWTRMTGLLERSQDVGRILVDARGRGLLHHVPPDSVIGWVGGDRSRQIAVAEMCSAHEAPLNPLARALIMKFGAESPAAAVIAARAHSTPRAVSSLGLFARAQLANARTWASDGDPEVARWGARMIRELEQSAEAFDAHEEYERKRRG